MSKTSNTLTEAVSSSVGRKFVMALSGLFLVSFLIVHLAGNFTLLLNDGGEAFNAYAAFMSTNPVIRVLEIGMFAGFLIHIIDGLSLVLSGKRARPVSYAVKRDSANSSWYSRSMGFTGTMILIFLIIHLNAFFVKHRFGHPGETMYETVRHAFETGWGGFYWLFYVVMMGIIGMHLNHGFQSAFQSLGWNHPKYTPLIKRAGSALAIAMAVGYMVIPIVFYLRYIRII